MEGNLENKFTLLSELLHTYLNKDVSGFLNIDNISAYNNLIRILVYRRGNLLNKSELASSINISFETVNKYLDALEGTFVFSYLPPYFTNVRKEITKMPKVYIEDFGLVRYISNSKKIEDYTTLEGKDIENYSYRYFRRILGASNVFYYRTISKSEIDLIGIYGEEFIPVEVKFTNKIRDNISLPMKNFTENYKKIHSYIFISKNTLSFDKEKNIYFIPVYLLEFIKDFEK
ncbi:MAG: DUF4143 domain-containing protein [Leptospiraceae bacterium]|nr:DUF4143 domain-containing protein [Leptospiraceae bacterium]